MTETKCALESEARNEAESMFDSPTHEEFCNAVISVINKSSISIVEEPVVKEVDNKRDEVYFTQEKYKRISTTNDGVRFKTTSTMSVVVKELTGILGEFGVSKDMIEEQSKSSIESDKTWYVVQSPFMMESEQEKLIQQKVNELIHERREYIEVSKDDVKGDCPRDDCDGKQYQDGYGSYGPKYKCTRLECSFQFERDVL